MRIISLYPFTILSNKIISNVMINSMKRILALYVTENHRAFAPGRMRQKNTLMVDVSWR